MNEYELSVNKMDVGEKIISSGILGIDKYVYPKKGKLAKKISYRKAFSGNYKDLTEKIAPCLLRSGVVSGVIPYFSIRLLDLAEGTPIATVIPYGPSC